MKTKLIVDSNEFVLEDQLSPSRSIIMIGKESEEAYNVIPTGEHWDLFQCQLTHSERGWLLRNGQWRTECPKGIRSRLQHACQVCRGCCVNVRTANPKYSWRFPACATLLNGKIVPEEGIVVKDGDIITIADGKSDFFISICFAI